MAKSNSKARAIIEGVYSERFFKLGRENKYGSDSWKFANRMLHWIDSNTNATLPLLGKSISLTANQLHS
ncbi:hypothetical protein [Vibrio anguillarum]|uniref:Uncharacterized protein n=1 Tax=Vibrio anguillarum TaxID=55601 RepID=A0ABR9Z7Y4_VIBAN|nr:hypothetical protein [Vibrio anguillarum]MBF4374513.1 hypothetical protein [Vibrio anguillarum]